MGRKLIDTVLTRKRLSLSMSQDKVAKLIGCNLSTYSAWETGKIMSGYTDGKSADYIRRLADLYGTTIKQIEEAISNAYIKAKRNERTLDSLYKENDDDMNKVTDSKLRARREELGYTAFEVADTIGISEVTLNQWEVGYTKRPKNKSAVMSLAELYGWGVNETYMAIEEAYNNKYPWLADNKSEVVEEVNDPFAAEYEDSIEVSGANDSDSDEESIIDIAREAYENVVNEPAEDNRSYSEMEEDYDNEGPAEDDTITCRKAIDMALDAVFAWGRNRQVYDDMLETMKENAPKDADHRTIKEHQIETYILSLIYGNVSFDTFCTIKDSLKSCLDMMKSFEEE